MVIRDVWRKRASLRARILFFWLVAGALVPIAILVFVLQLRTLNSAARITREESSRLILATDISRYVYELQLLAHLELDGEDLAGFAAKAEPIISALHAANDELELQLQTLPASDLMRAYIRVLTIELQSTTNLASQAIELAQQGELEPARSKLRTLALPRRQLTSAIDHLIRLARQRYDDAERQIALTRGQMLLSVHLVIVALIWSGVVMYSFTMGVRAQVKQLSNAATRLAAGHFEERIPVKVEDELGELAIAFNSTAEALQTLYASLEQQVRERTRALERRSLELEAAAQVAREAAAIRDVKQLLEQTVHLISERFGFYHAGIFLIDEAGEYAVLQAASSEGGQRMLARGHKLKVGQVGIVGYVAGSGEPRIALDVGEDAVYFDNPDLPDTHSEMALPLKVRDRVIGVLDVQSTAVGAFSDKDVAILQTMADQLAIAIENARLLEERERALRELETLYGQQVRDAWREYASLRPLAYRYTGVTIEQTAPSPVDIPTTHPTIVEQNGTRQLIAPIRLRGETIGVVTFRQDKASGGKPWSEDELVLVEELCTQIGLALENARLLEETRQRAAQEQILANITARVRASLDPETILQTALRELGLALGADRVFVRLGR
ncbi:MAG: GAF domain-containing protein [Anaerolineae bacterium]|nr:GAF domain-containing protein [Anaerolineae bacterium]